MGKIKINLPEKEIKEFCKKWKITEFSLFGSVLREDFGPDSDVDVMVDFESYAHHTLLDLVQMQEELSEILKREVDIITKRAVQSSRNYIRKKAILENNEVIYGS